jgi:16S rRNA (guanine966-N2)-methyltransferase
MTKRGTGLPGRLRIVGGEWRGRRLAVLDQPGLRPTPDRVRETLFNWLAPLIIGARCLDLYAGSGALGFEAASRGAGRVVMIEKLAKVVCLLHENRLLLNARQVEVVHAEAGPWLAMADHAEPFDLVFLDPPFSEDLLGQSCAALTHGGWLARGARVYLEAPATTGFPPLPEGWRLLRDKQAGQVRYGLAEAR